MNTSSTALAPRPARSNWARVIYNVLHDNGRASAMSREAIWAAIPASMHTPHSKGKFTSALSNMVYNGYLKSYDQVGTRTKAYRLNTRPNYDVRRAEIKAQNTRRETAKANKKTAAPVRAASSGPVTNTLQGAIKRQMERLDRDIDALIAKRALLRSMYKTAGKL